jgi:hypothetical protein
MQTLGLQTLAACCLAGRPAASCPGLPLSYAGVDPWPPSCADQAAGFTCATNCSISMGFTGRITSACLSSGAWTTVRGHCSRITCAGVPSAAEGPVHVRWPDSCAGSASDAVCVGTCTAGSEGNLTAVCSLSGAWGPATGNCTPATSCPGLPPASDGARWNSTCDGAAVGSLCVAECAEGTVGAVNSSCTATGWTAPNGSCELLVQGEQLI